MTRAERSNSVREEMLWEDDVRRTEMGELRFETYAELVGRRLSGGKTILHVLEYATGVTGYGTM